MRTDVAADQDRITMLTVRGLVVRVAVRKARGRLAGDPPLLVCNGLGASLEVLQPLVDALDQERAVIRFDVPGVGASPAPPLPYVMATLSSWVAALVTRLGYREFDVLGLSWGGLLAQQLAVQSRLRVRRLVLVATGTGALVDPARAAVLTRLMTPRRHRDPAYTASVAAQLYGGSMRVAPERAAGLLHAGGQAGSMRGYYFQLAATMGWSSLAFLPLVRQPTLVLAGDDDPIIGLADARLLARLVPGARLHVYRGGHLGLLSESDELVPVIESFLQRPALHRRPANGVPRRAVRTETGN